MKTLTIGEDNYLIPGNWNELTNDQLIFLVRMMQNKVSTEEVKLKLLLYCMNAQVRRQEKTPEGLLYHISAPKKKNYALTPMQMSAMADIFDYLFIYIDEQYCINPMLTRNPFPKTNCGCRTVYGPADGLTDITYQQFADLQIWQTKIEESKDYLNMFLSIIYKDKKDVPLNVINKMSPTVKTCIVWFYLGCLNFLQNKFPKVFSGSGDKSGDVVDGQMRIIDALAQGKLVDKDSVKNSLLWDALYTMEIAAEEMERLERERTKNR